jgi:hypothetical protein
LFFRLAKAKKANFPSLPTCEHCSQFASADSTQKKAWFGWPLRQAAWIRLDSVLRDGHSVACEV